MLPVKPQKIFKSSISLLIAFFLIQPCFGQKEQSKQDKTEKKSEVKQPFFRAWSVQLDLASPISGKFFTPDIFSSEASLNVNIRNTWFPVWEFGYANINHTDGDGAQFTTKAIFNRIGFNISILNNKNIIKPVKSIFYAGLRLGHSSFNYNINNITITDNYWKTTQAISSDNNNASATWGEFVAGVQVNVIKNITLGWTARLKTGLSITKKTFSPWYVPGFGIVNGSGWGFTYSIGYIIPSK
ncbi:DUF6048 family protein [Microbacter margulisiae]|uniref:Outer membrane protein beta-barrel domain-containing protein n=1 Tax=Microbacter margulisiae TaxID=1350067 RepID=A0A7W5H1U0_9PORP|nr:DUF6048 family protein [Microbacter margulisiae]MBB3186726.1 hypothetical protein [Microbacter margulisiae]